MNLGDRVPDSNKPIVGSAHEVVIIKSGSGKHQQIASPMLLRANLTWLRKGHGGIGLTPVDHTYLAVARKNIHAG